MPAHASAQPLVGIIMGSKSDWETLSHAADMLDQLGVPYEARVLSAHRTPDALFEYASTAEQRGLGAIIAGAGAAAHLAGVTAAKAMIPVLGVPIESGALKGLDALLSTVQMPGGVPVATFAIGKAGAVNAAIFAANILGTRHAQYRDAVRRYREGRTKALLEDSDPRKSSKPA